MRYTTLHRPDLTHLLSASLNIQHGASCISSECICRRNNNAVLDNMTETPQHIAINCLIFLQECVVIYSPIL